MAIDLGIVVATDKVVLPAPSKVGLKITIHVVDRDTTVHTRVSGPALLRLEVGTIATFETVAVGAVLAPGVELVWKRVRGPLPTKNTDADLIARLQQKLYGTPPLTVPEIDPRICHCGEYMHNHPSPFECGHSAMPMEDEQEHWFKNGLFA